MGQRKVQHSLKNQNTPLKPSVQKIAKSLKCDYLIDKRECDYRKTIKDIVGGFPYVANVKAHVDQ